jgi:N-acetylglucosamine kinase-like BadF-type ATPase
MSDDEERLCLGVDGGGTKTAVWLGRLTATHDLIVIGQATGGSANVRAIGFTEAQSRIGEVIKAAFLDAGRSPTKAASLCLSLAGAGRPEEQSTMTRWALEQEIASEVRVTGDAELLLSATTPFHQAFTEQPGICVISGTGSMVWGRNDFGNTARCGGWGYLFGDEGSAYAIGRAALEVVSQTADGRNDAHELVAEFMEHYGFERLEDCVAWCYGSSAPKETIASLASWIFEMATQNRHAQTIVSTAARLLAIQVDTVVGRLGYRGQDYRLICTGGVLLHQANYRRLVEQSLPKRPSLIEVVEHPVQGAINLAALMSRKRITS